MMRATTRVLLLAGILFGPDRAAATQTNDARDPFVRPSPRGRPQPVVAARPRGLAGIAVDQVILRGLVRLDDARVAILETDDGRSHAIRGGEELFDGYVQSVTAAGVVIVVDGPGAAARAVRLTLGSPSGER